jgi:hypothetical protein
MAEIGTLFLLCHRTEKLDGSATIDLADVAIASFRT